jgi:hypothetical protein
MESMINRWKFKREDTLTAKAQKLNQNVDYRARELHAACLPAVAHCVKKLIRSATDTVGFSVPQAQGMRSTAKELSAIMRAPREVCRTGHCAQPSIYQLPTAVDPATATGGAAAAAACAGGPQLRREKNK